LCNAGCDDEGSYVAHLNDVHGLVDDEGTTSASREPRPPAIEPMPGFAPIEQPAPPVGRLTAPNLWPAPPPPPPLAVLPGPPPQAQGSRVPPAVIAAIIVTIVVVTLGAMVWVTRSGSRAEEPAADRFLPATRDAPEPSSHAPDTITPSTPTLVNASSSSATDSVDPAEARDVATRLWRGRAGALTTADTAALRVFDDGPLLESDIGSICQVGCPLPSFSASFIVAVNVPHQSGWPATFFASVSHSECDRSGLTCVSDFVATQPVEGAPWKATLLITYTDENAYSEGAQLLPDGFAVAPPDAAPTVPPLLTDFAGYYTALKTTGSKPASTNLADGAFTSGQASRLFDPPEAQHARGIEEVVTYGVDRADPIHTFVDSSGETKACGTIRYTTHLTSGDGSPLDAEVALREYHVRLDDGLYQSMTLRGLHMICFGVPQHDNAVVIASSGGTTSVTGEPA
jgi:hypothetical protein